MVQECKSVIEEAKICSKCGLEKPLSDYSKYKFSRDGHNTMCKLCRYLHEKKRKGWVNKEEAQKRRIKATEFPDGTKLCSKCKIIKPLSSFTALSKGKFITRVSTCKECNKFYAKSLKYGIKEEDYEEMLKDQDYRCKICGERAPLVIDHCHTTNKIRGLLCDPCNLAIGLMKDDLSRLSSAIEYLKSANL